MVICPMMPSRPGGGYLTIDKQGVDGMSKVHGLLDPEARATVEAVFAKLAAPGMCNPDDETPCVDGEPSEEAAHGDTRSQGQRNHDALKAMGRSVLASGELGQHNGLPATIIVSTSLQDLQAAAGVAVTAGGTLLPMREVIKQASQAHHYLVIYDKHTREPLYCGRAKRFATRGQRIVLHALDRGCTRPGCTAPGYWSQVHHVDGWAAAKGETDINKLTLACGPDNRLIEESGWTTRKRKDGRTEWIPPPHLDTGQSRVNDYHHPEKYLNPTTNRMRMTIRTEGLEPRTRLTGRCESAQPQAVAHDKDRTESHCGACDHRVEQACGGQGECRDVVGERPEQVALDRRQCLAGQPDCVGDRTEIVTDQREVACLDRDVGAAAHREAEVRLCERGRVVDAVADHRHHLALGLQSLDRVDLLVGQHLGDHLVDTHLPRRPCGQPLRCRP